jgi:hypothetical protein
MLGLAIAFALGDLLPQRMGDYRLAETPSGAKGVYSRKGRREATLLLTRESGISCVSTASVHAARHDVGGQRGCLFIAPEADPHIAPLVLAWQFREMTAWLTLNRASGSDRQRAAWAAEDAQRFIEARAKE